MKKKIAILGSTGSIGKTLLNIVNQNKDLIVLLLPFHNKICYSILYTKEQKWIK